jgi:hypothetical protein
VRPFSRVIGQPKSLTKSMKLGWNLTSFLDTHLAG